MRRSLGALVLVVLLAPCGGDDDGGSGGGGGGAVLRPENGEVTLVAENQREWEAERIEIPAGEEVTIVVDNRDEGIPHNLHIRDLPGGDLETELEQGPDVQELEVQVEDAGRYDYLCDVHPAMDGTLVVE